MKLFDQVEQNLVEHGELLWQPGKLISTGRLRPASYLAEGPSKLVRSHLDNI
jgi:hypothetical protein